MEFVNLSNVCDVYSGYAFKRFNDNKEGMQVIKIGNIKTDGSINKMSCSYTEEIPLKKFFSQKDDLYIALSGATTGKVGIMDEVGYLINQRVGVIRRKDMNIPINYIKFFLDSITEKILRDAVGAAQPNISPRDILKYKFPLRTYNEMSIISNVLVKINSDIKECKNYIANLDNIVKSQFVELFDDNAPIAKLGDVCRMINGDRGKNYPSSDDFVENGVPFVNAGHLQNRKVDFCDMNYITEEKFNLLSQGKMQEGDILYCLRGSLGKHGLVDFERGAVASSLVILRCNQEQVLPQFLLYALETPEIELQLKATNNGSSQPNLSAVSVKAYDIKLPAIEQQKQFVSFVEQTDKSKYFGGVCYGIC